MVHHYCARMKLDTGFLRKFLCPEPLRWQIDRKIDALNLHGLGFSSKASEQIRLTALSAQFSI